MSHSVLGLWDYATRIWIFGALMFSLQTFMTIVELAVPDFPHEVTVVTG